MKQLLRSFSLSLGLTIIAFGYVLWHLGAGATVIMLVLAAIELAFSFDNAVINAKVLGSLSPLWQKLFLSLGIVIAIFGVRLLLPLVIVGITTHLPFARIIDIALHHPRIYAQQLDVARPGIASFGGAFLLMLVLHFFMAERDTHWLQPLERLLSRRARWWLPLVCTCIVVGSIALLPWNMHRGVMLQAGAIGAAAYAFMNGLIEYMSRTFGRSSMQRVGWAAFATFMYLELLDASLSFDGVIGAFAVTSEVLLIALGLGVGAIWVRTLTVHMVRHRMLDVYKYLEHGAHYAIAVLAITMLGSVIVQTPDFVTGALCLGIIAAALLTSREAVTRS